jgi:hypothetical protein
MQTVFGIAGLALTVMILLASIGALMMVCRKQRL